MHTPVFENVIPAGSEYIGKQVANDGTAPGPADVRGVCPECGAALVSNLAYVGGQGYIGIWVCWEALAEVPMCNYQRVL